MFLLSKIRNAIIRVGLLAHMAQATVDSKAKRGQIWSKYTTLKLILTVLTLLISKGTGLGLKGVALSSCLHLNRLQCICMSADLYRWRGTYSNSMRVPSRVETDTRASSNCVMHSLLLWKMFSHVSDSFTAFVSYLDLRVGCINIAQNSGQENFTCLWIEVV